MGKRSLPALIVSAVGAVLLWSSLARSSIRGKRHIVAIGASSTVNGVYARSVARQQGRGSTSRSVGWSGMGSKHIGDRIDQALFDSPTDVIISAVINDIASGRSLRTIKKNNNKMFEAVASSGARVIVLLSSPNRGYSRWKPEWEKKLASFAKWARAHPLVDVVVNPRPGMQDQDGRLKRQYDSGDHLHLNRKGAVFMGKLIHDQSFG